jgi:hypothetical protein
MSLNTFLEMLHFIYYLLNFNVICVVRKGKITAVEGEDKIKQGQKQPDLNFIPICM